ncbi:MAG: hypothetical protein KA297_13750 [Kofleriaceae bacterium]|jgi:hypothetical protein|nr:hypothetical protein [Kofleriaceae bacterium]
MQQPTKPDSFASASISSAPSPSLEPEPGAGRGPRPGHPTGAQVQAICEAMVTTVARVAYDWPGIEHALLDAIHHVSHALPYIDSADRSSRSDLALLWFSTHEAYLSVVTLAQRLRPANRGGARGAGEAWDAVAALLDVLDPLVSRADRAVRRVALDDIDVIDAVRCAERALPDDGPEGSLDLREAPWRARVRAAKSAA